MDNKKKIFIGIGIFWLVIIFGFIGLKEYTLRTGTEVLLKLRPIDPRDMFRGDYVILSYDISTIARSDMGELNRNDTIYTKLIINEKVAVFAGASKDMPTSSLFIAGKVANAGSSRIRVIYGIESYFVPEGTGRVIERSTKDMYAKVVIDSSGGSVVKL